ncbi:hypothetical protein D8S78_10855 [Natrialba swarupiae]|nr:hypothetical protein [Natrialba swarupiae]
MWIQQSSEARQRTIVDDYSETVYCRRYRRIRDPSAVSAVQRYSNPSEPVPNASTVEPGDVHRPCVDSGGKDHLQSAVPRETTLIGTVTVRLCPVRS